MHGKNILYHHISKTPVSTKYKYLFGYLGSKGFGGEQSNPSTISEKLNQNAMVSTKMQN